VLCHALVWFGVARERERRDWEAGEEARIAAEAEAASRRAAHKAAIKELSAQTQVCPQRLNGIDMKAATFAETDTFCSACAFFVCELCRPCRPKNSMPGWAKHLDKAALHAMHCWVVLLKLREFAHAHCILGWAVLFAGWPR
jgi:hypothetical protein